MIQVRALEPFDEPLLPHFLALAAHEADSETALANPDLARYVEGWGRYGDVAVVAEEPHTRIIVGMAWARFWTPDNCGFGWIDELTPELAVAVEPPFQGRGIGSELIEALKCRLRAVLLAVRWDARQQKIVAISQPVEEPQPDMTALTFDVALNVRAESPAVALYERLGFVKVENSERPNRAGSQSFNMIAPIRNGTWRKGWMDRTMRVNWAGAPPDFVSVAYVFVFTPHLFSSAENEAFIQFMTNLPGVDLKLGEVEGLDARTEWVYFGPAPVKATIQWPHLYAKITPEGLQVLGNLEWKQWCDWDDAFQERASLFPHNIQAEGNL